MSRNPTRAHTGTRLTQTGSRCTTQKQRSTANTYSESQQQSQGHMMRLTTSTISGGSVLASLPHTNAQVSSCMARACSSLHTLETVKYRMVQAGC